VETVHGRAEDIGQNPDYRERFDICLSRAVANLSTLSEYCLPLVRVGGFFGAYKTADAEEEFNAARKAVAILGGRYEETTDTAFSSAEKHRIYWICKESATPKKYPRKAGIPSKNPL